MIGPRDVRIFVAETIVLGLRSASFGLQAAARLCHTLNWGLFRIAYAAARWAAIKVDVPAPSLAAWLSGSDSEHWQ